jgi:hypothetical protein
MEAELRAGALRSENISIRGHLKRDKPVLKVNHGVTLGCDRPRISNFAGQADRVIYRYLVQASDMFLLN